MERSDDEEEEVVPEAVTDYHFVDGAEEPVCFSTLPLLCSEDDSTDVHKGQVFLHGKTDDGLQKIYKQVVAWKVEIEGDSPVVSILSKDKKWLKLLKPRKAYEDTIRKIMIALECLSYLRRNPASSEKSLWEHVGKVFRQFEIGASEDDLLDHQTLIQTMVKRDETLSKSQPLLKFLSDLPKKKDMSKKAQNSDFINDDVEEADNNDGDESEEEEVECFDTVCAICDNGGELLCCEGQCLRSFHATKDAGVDSDCKTLGYTRAQVRAIQNFLCPNCVHKKHQCFSCGKLGISDKESGNAEVFRCISASCGHFYHPHCVAKRLHPKNEAEAAALEKNIPAGESFLCPVHKCRVCGQIEDKEVEELQFALCRRCPTSYHRKCLPREISFDDSEEEELTQRAWDDLIPNRILIYCLKHEIDEDIGTPVRNHIIFPGRQESKLVQPTDSGKVKILAKRKAEDLFRGKKLEKLDKQGERVTSGTEASELRSVKKLKTSDVAKKVSNDSTKKGSILDKKKLPVTDERVRPSVRSNGLEILKSVKKDMLSTKVGEVAPSSMKKEGSTVPLIVDEEAKKRILLLVKKSPSSSLTVEDLLKKKRLPATYTHCARQVGKNITRGKVEGSIEAIRAALQKFEKGCSIEDAKAVCGPDILNQILSWKRKFRVYLAPFLHGVRYSSYGRHFTKVNKLEEIVEKLHWYVQNGDMIVDFCCGANDFSLLMKKKLEATGKKCLFKNFDLFQPKNDFNFEKRDWMTVHPRELPTGSQLIMGLNPPFGVNAALANKFIDKALEFKPKLLILIVPKETERLDRKKAAYDLIWEDEEKLSGMSFYLPGSVDVNDNQIEQWNTKPPPLYLWSRPDWTARHKGIALKHGHTSSHSKEAHLEVDKEPQASVNQVEDHNRSDTRTELLPGLPQVQNGRAVRYVEKGASTARHKGIALKHGHTSSHSKESHLEVDKEPQASVNQVEDHHHSDTRTELLPGLPQAQNGRAVRYVEKGASPDVQVDKSKLENNVDRKAGQETDEDGDRKKSEKSRVKKRKKSRKGKSKGQDETVGNVTAGHISDMSISPPHQTEPQQMLDVDLTLDARSGGKMGVAGFNRPPQGFGAAFGGESKGSLPRDDIDSLERRYGRESIDSLERRYSRDSVDNLERRYAREGIDSLERQYGTSRSFSSSYDLLNNSTGKLSYEGHYGSNERFPGYIRDSPLPSFEPVPYVGEERRMRTDTHTSLRMYGQQEPNDATRNWHTVSGSNTVPVQTGSFSTSYGLSGSAIGSSAMNRYAPRLDELNHVGRPGDSSTFEMPGSRPSFTSGSPNLFPSHRPSGGWLDE